MKLQLIIVFLFLTFAASFPFPPNTLERIRKISKSEFESSGSGPGENVRGLVRVIQMDPRSLAQSGFFMRKSRAQKFRSSFPSFLSQGLVPKAPASPPHHPQADMEHKKRQGLHMWQKAINKGNKAAVSLPANLKDAKQTCAAIPFIQRVTADGCSTVTVHNKLCFGQCSSLFVPYEVDLAAEGFRQRPPCSRCGPSKTHAVTVPLQCGTEIRHTQVMLVQECKCESGREQKNAEESSPHV